MKHAVLPVAALTAALLLMAPWSAPQAQQAARAAQASAQENQVAKLFRQRFAGVAVDGVSRTPYGLYEVRIGSDLLYTDEKVSFIIEGSLIDAATRKNVTRERMEQLLAVDFDSLPLDLAIKQVRGNGSRKVAVFEDPNCGYCKQLRRVMESLENVTIYTFVYPILSPDSTAKSRAMLCASDPGKAWDDWMLRGKQPPAAPANCDTSAIEKVVELGRKLKVSGTPTLIFSDSTRVGGAIPADQFKQRLDALGRGKS